MVLHSGTWVRIFRRWQDSLEYVRVIVHELVGYSGIKKTSEQGDFLSSVNTKTLKQCKKILQLSPQDRSTIYKMVDSLLKK